MQACLREVWILSVLLGLCLMTFPEPQFKFNRARAALAARQN